MKWMTGAALLALATGAVAQDAAPFELGTDKIDRSGLGNCTKDQTIIVPTAYLMVAAQSFARAEAGNAVMNSAMGVDGLDKAVLQSLARRVQDDLIERLRANGYTVQGWEALQPSVTGAGRLRPDARYGLPVQRDRVWMNADFVVAAPTDDQALEFTMGFPNRSMLGASYKLKTTVLVPILSFTMQRATRETRSGGAVDSAGVTLQPEMRLHYAQLWGSSSKGAGCSLIVNDTMRRVVGTDVGALERVPGARDRLNAVLHLDRTAFQAAVMRGAIAVNALSAASLRRQ